MSVSKRSYIERLLVRLRNEVGEAEFPLVQTFAELLWMRTLDDDLVQREINDVADITLSCWRRLSNHRGEEVSILLDNPPPTDNDAHSNHTVVQVTAPNMPFMVDSVLMALSHDGLVTHLLTNVVFAVDRDPDGRLTNISTDITHTDRELLVYAEIDRLDDDELPMLHQALESMARELQSVVADYGAMKGVVEAIMQGLLRAPPSLPMAEIEEGYAFLKWLLANHFTFLGYREFAYKDGLIRQVGPAYGMLRVRAAASERLLADQSEETRNFLMSKALLTFSKSGTKSQVHRHAYPDYVGVKRYDDEGNVIGEMAFLGLYTSRVYKEFPEQIPHVRQKVAGVFQRSGLDLNGFDGKVLAEVLATYPRDELVQISEQELFTNAMVITDIHERRRVRVFPRYDAYGLFVTVLVYLPRDLFNTQVRLNVHKLLVTTFDAEDADYDAHFSESILVRLQYNLRIRHGSRPHVDRIELEQQIAELIGDWVSELNATLLERFGTSQGRALRKQYANAFPAGYQEEFSVAVAIDDIAAIETMHSGNPLSTRFYRDSNDPNQALVLKIYHLHEPLPLSDVIPKLENMGVRIHGEHPYTVNRTAQSLVSVHNFELEFGHELDLDKLGDNFNTAFLNAWNGQSEDDSYNRLVLTAGLDCRQVSVLRAYAQYMKQIRFGFSQRFISDTLDQHRNITADLVRYFETRFRPNSQLPASARNQNSNEQQVRLQTAFEGVALLNEDRVLRRFLELIDATQRTNYFRTDEHNEHRSFLALKLAPIEISNMPQPAPMFEIFVSSADFEGVHLRRGPIARGGLRWSDRREDYRTEVLGLVKAQVVKNAVIVPTGAKGGFVVKSAREGVACYRDFIRGLLDTTDNILDGEVVTPANVHAHDIDDPYLVVAADKGTATFSDEANAVAREYNFWLGDAFASGGSNGYDHKKMGITAKGAWVSVQRHFAEQDIDIQVEPVSVLGIGDMAGDVFGNGMLSSRCLKLVAAFNHLHIFIDPDPDPQASFAERERLFKMPRSNWDDYDTNLLSRGGGIFARTEKSINLSKEMQVLFSIDESNLSPDDLINRLLKSPVQLIWNGGIGTYVKSSTESDDDVGDRANDSLRVDASDLRCQVFGEGGNLGLTQRARIEFCRNGGAANTDFIDNSAGVDCSDHEVNIKIALDTAVTAGELDVSERNGLLEEMTDDVARLVLNNNYLQAQTLSLAERHATTRGPEYRRTITFFTQHAGLNRQLEYLPSDEALAERFSDGNNLSRPELAVLLAYAKTQIKTALIDSDIHTDNLIAEILFTSFPARLAKEHRQSLQGHRLAREVVATQLANEIVDHMGITFVPHMLEFVGGTVPDIARAYVVVARCFELKTWFDQVRNLKSVKADLQLAILLELIRLGRRATRWVMRHKSDAKSAQALIDELKPNLTILIRSRNGAIGDQGLAWQDRVAALVEAGLPIYLAKRSANAAHLASLLPTIDVAHTSGCDPMALAETATMIGHELHLDWMSIELANLEGHSHWQAMERDALLDEISTLQSRLGAKVLLSANGDFDRWVADVSQPVHNWHQTVDEARHTSLPDFSMYAVMVRKLSDLVAPNITF